MFLLEILGCEYYRKNRRKETLRDEISHCTMSSDYLVFAGDEKILKELRS